MPTSLELLRLAERAATDKADLIAQRDRLNTLISTLDEQERGLREMAAKLGPLRGTGNKGTLGVPNMQAAEQASRGAKVSIARTSKPWPMQAALHRRNLSLPEWARAQSKKGLTVEAAKSWLKRPSHGGRPVPRVWAKRIAEEFVDDETGAPEVPAVDEAWPNGIR